LVTLIDLKELSKRKEREMERRRRRKPASSCAHRVSFEFAGSKKQREKEACQQQSSRK